MAAPEPRASSPAQEVDGVMPPRGGPRWPSLRCSVANTTKDRVSATRCVRAAPPRSPMPHAAAESRSGERSTERSPTSARRRRRPKTASEASLLSRRGRLPPPEVGASHAVIGRTCDVSTPMSEVGPTRPPKLSEPRPSRCRHPRSRPHRWTDRPAEPVPNAGRRRRHVHANRESS